MLSEKSRRGTIRGRDATKVLEQSQSRVRAEDVGFPINAQSSPSWLGTNGKALCEYFLVHEVYGCNPRIDRYPLNSSQPSSAEYQCKNAAFRWWSVQSGYLLVKYLCMRR